MRIPSAAPPDDFEEDSPEREAPGRRGIGPRFFAFVVAVVALAGAALLVLTTDPDPRQERIFIALVLLSAAGLGSIFATAFGIRTGRPLADALRALRRGVLFGLACAGVVVLQLNVALSPTNLAFLLLVLLIVEMIFLARRQHPI